MDLSDIRKELDEVDSQIIMLYEKRMMLSESIAACKHVSGLNIYDPKREVIKINQVVSSVVDPIDEDGVRELFELLMKHSKERQQIIVNKLSEE